MRKKKIWWCIPFLCLFLFCFPLHAAAKDEESDPASQMMEEVDLTELDEWIGEELFPKGEDAVTFTDVVDGLIEDGITGFDYSLIADWLRDALFYEIKNSWTLLVQVILLVVGFSILKNFSNAFQSAYIADLCFLMVYCVLAVMLLQSFLGFRDIAEEALNKIVEFMQALIPPFCLTMVFSAGAGTSAGFYQLAFLVVYLVQWLFLKILMPMIQLYVILELVNHFFEDEKFQNLTELMGELIGWGLKLAGAAVFGLTVVQNLIAPAKDKLASGTVSKAASVIPGIGNAINGISELLIGSGIMIKNCVGVAALIILVVLGAIPILKIWCMAFFYKLAAVVTEPVADKRIAGCLAGMAKGGMLYLRLVIYCLALFFLTIALTTAAV